VLRCVITFAMSSGLLATAAFGQLCGDANLGVASSVIEIDGVKMSLAEVERKRPQLFQARSGFYEVQRKGLQDFVDEYLLDKQAKKENVTVAELLERHVNSKADKKFPEEALRFYYEGVDTTEPFEALRDKIVQHLQQKRVAKAKTAYLETLRKQADVSIRLAAPRATVSLKDTPIRGRAGSPVVLVEFADFECPYCQQSQPALDRVLAEYKDKVAFAYKDAPLPMHANAQKAAEAAHCAGSQGKYWEYYDLLASAKQFEVPKLKERARELKLDGAAFDKCLDSSAKAGIVKAGLEEAQALGLQGTPSFFLNGRYFSGLMSYEKLRDLIEEELKAASQTGGRIAAGQ
jgi:protein-disulfide isomerase